MTSIYSYDIENISQGEFALRANGTPIGRIAGGNGHWKAEVDSPKINPIEAKSLCADMILGLAHSGADSIRTQMAAIIEAHPMRRDAKQDFYIEDSRFLAKWAGATNLIWIVTNNATHLHPLDFPNSADEISDALDRLFPEDDAPQATLYLLDFTTNRVSEISVEAVRSLLFYTPKYELEQATVKRHGRSLATIVTRPSHRTGYGHAQLCHVTVECESEPDAADVVVLSALAFIFPRRYEGNRYAAPESIEVRNATSILYRWKSSI
ncbi:hypothetical protein [Noviherbaspirillum pedocola]|uniref:Uncharacterized protein n=1 Tax=Noviherbaspirillum pedocola TaxID=2801341 RepID=A0A934SZS5_9BURK|nr:hypothetical protein [Noviherbaspirillum pedocola]MBK4736037.1 hypothetical protein [Noviherbaspirillum pedocola]